MNKVLLKKWQQYPFRIWMGLLLLLFAPGSMTFADEMKKEGQYTMTTSTDHVTFEILLTDLNSSNTWAKWGSIRAYSEDGRKGTVLWLMDVQTQDWGNDYAPEWDAYARVCLKGARAWFKNGYYTSEMEISYMSDNDWNSSPKRYTLDKGSNNDYLKAKIDFYFPPEMTGRKWHFYYEYLHNKGTSYNMKLGSAYLSNQLGYESTKINQFSYERKGPDKIDFTVPAIPDDIPQKLKENRKYETSYELSFKYTLQDNSIYNVKENLQCEVGHAKTYTLTIPEQVGNFLDVDLTIKAKDGLKCENGDYFWNVTAFYNRYGLFKTVPVPYGLNAEYYQFDGKVELVWNGFTPGSSFIKECDTYVYRLETNAEGKALNGSTWEKRGKVEDIGSTSWQSYSDKNVSPNTYYKYMVVNVPKEWTKNNAISSGDLNNPPDELLNKLGHTESNVVATPPSMSIYNLAQDLNETEKVRLTWEYSRVPVKSSTVSFQVLRRANENVEWVEYGHVNADANPTSGKVASFIDTDLPNNRVRYEYKIALSINDGANRYESDVVKAGLISGSTVTRISATKGMHENVVRVSWKVKQVGTDATNFDIYRRYANSKDEYLKLYSTSGVADNYTYEDNTALSGYYYEYKVESYSGERDETDEVTYQNSLTDVGFCQARGVISGRITYGTGSAVEDVRISLLASDSSDDNQVKGYSQHVSGPSTGIVWDGDSTEVANLLGEEKSYTLQMFIRPDEGLNDATAVSIPGKGQLVLTEPQNSKYKLLWAKSFSLKPTEIYTDNLIRLRGVYYMPHNNTRQSFTFTDEQGREIKVFGKMDFDNLEKEWEDEGYRNVKEWGATWVNSGDDRCNVAIFMKRDNLVLGESSVISRDLYDTGLTLDANIFSQLSILNDNGALTFNVDGDVSKEETFYKTSALVNGVYTANEIPDTYYPFKGNYLDFSGTLLPTLKDNEWMYSFLAEYSGTEKQREGTPRDATAELLKGMKLTLGGYEGITEDIAFKGNFTEVRVWNRTLTEAERQTYSDRVLNGRESGLKLYWPMDEGLDRYVFDASYSTDLPNGHHATIGANIKSSTIIPNDDQLSRYGMTNANGEYTIRGIPFVGTGSTYTIVPTKGIHSFSPISRNGFIGSGSLALNSYDFTDQSSFPMRGTINYLNTNIPVDSVQFKIDGQLVMGDEAVIMSDADGEYEISVPIGQHRIEAYRNGHRLTSFPREEGKKWDFKQSEIVNFIDSTLVNVTGRINGGFSDQNAPVGFGLSKNRLGKAVIKLSLGKESQCSFNYILDEHGDGRFGTENLPVESATPLVNSTAYRAGGSHDDTYFVYITTDAETGEYSALLPPLKYKVESIKFAGGTDYDNLPIFSQNLPIIDASNAVKETMQKDTLSNTENMSAYEYSVKTIWQYRSTPVVNVYQEGMDKGGFGEVKVPLANPTEKIDSVAAITYSGNGYAYDFGYPLFMQQGTYEFGIDVSEDYVNLDTKEVFHEIPTDAVVSIANDASILTTVYGEKAIVDGVEVAAGSAYEVQNIKIVPDAKGHVSYNWTGGWPNLGEGYLRNISIGVNIDGRTTMWKAPDSASDALDLVLLGSLSTGTNFVTEGPEHVDMILRRPPGSTSEASLENETITSTVNCSVNVENGRSFGGGAFVSLTPTFDIDTGTGIGVYLIKESHWKIVAETENTQDNKWWDTTETEKENTYTVTREMTTSPEFIQNGGDTYIGRSTNLLFGKGRLLGIFLQPDSTTFKLDLNEAITVGETFNTTFALPQEYIVNTLIPNWQAIIDSKLTYVEGDHWDKNVAKEVEGEVRYYTKYKPGDPEYGRGNGDKTFWSAEHYKETGGWPSYRMVNGTHEGVNDEVEHAINQIKHWKKLIADNEKDKLEAFENRSEYLIDNFSIAGGTSVKESYKTENRTLTVEKEDYEFTFNDQTKFGAMINEAGAYGIITRSLFHSNSTGSGTGSGSSTNVSWTMSDADPRTALSVDVFKSKMNWGPIFRTRGGQTANPYEGATETLYYSPGSPLDEATMRVEYPQLKVKGATELTDVPTGGSAKFELEMTNLSETNSQCIYVLEAIESSNSKGAVLMIDGQPLSLGHTGRAITMEGNETITKTLFVSQSDRSVTDFNDLRLVLRSEKDEDNCSDTVRLTVHFVPASAIAELKVDHTVITQSDASKGFLVTVYNIDRQDKGLRGVRVQYRRKGTDAWTLARQWVQKKYMTNNDVELPDSSSVSCIVSMTDDGDYELRAQTFGKYGNDDVTYETDIIDVVQDMRGPKILGRPYPDGWLSYYNRDEMHVTFNESINVNALSKTDNFRIEGNLNNSSFDGQSRDVALQLNGDEIKTDASYRLADSDIAFDLWFYRQGDGNIISMGTENNRLSLFTKDGGKLGARIGAEEASYVSDIVLPADTWNYIAFSFKKKSESDSDNRITMLFVNSEMKEPQYTALNQLAPDLEGTGHLYVGGDGMKGMMHDLTLWNTNKSCAELYAAREEVKAAFTPGLVGYWRMDEGHGTTLYDKARSRNMTMKAESWYINNRNLAAHLDGKEPFRVDISPFAPRTTDNFALELWFRGDNIDDNQNATLVSVLNQMKINFQDGQLALTKSQRTVDGSNVEHEDIEGQIILSEANYIDNEWHHLALNVRRGSSAVVYVDGQAVKTLPENAIPAISGHFLCVGGEQTLLSEDGSKTGGYARAFSGDIDELRIWNAALTGSLIDERRYERLDSTFSGLIGYFPMESIERNEAGTVISNFNTKNLGNKRVINLNSEGTVTASINAPGLLPGSQRMRLSEQEFDFTASEDKIYISFHEDVLPKMDGNNFVVTIENVKDLHGNNSEPIEWTFYANVSRVIWASDVIEIEKRWDETSEFYNTLMDLANTMSTFEITGLPSWITIEDTQIDPDGDMCYTNYVFNIQPSAPIGRHTFYVYASDDSGFNRMFKINLTVRGDEPDWTVDPDLYESNMTLTGQIYVQDKISEYTESKIAAFDEMGLCRGVASPKYVSTRDAYFVDMVIYGGAASELSTSERDLTFKMYDASSGKTYPVVNVTVPGSTTDHTLLYSPDAIYGSYDEPVIFRATDMLQQITSLPRGWTWMSIYVNPESTAIANVLPKIKNDLKKFKNIKGHNAYASVSSDGSTILGQLQEIVPGNMYKMQVSAPITLNTVGYTINVRNTEQTIYPQYNWIGSLSNSVLSPAEAFAELEPTKGDMVKNRTSYSTYKGNGVWEGTLNSIVPGQGYIYLSRATEAKSFHYPATYSSMDHAANSVSMDLETEPLHFVPVDEHQFPDNMIITAVVEKDNQRIKNAEVGAFINGECRGAVPCIGGYYFLTIMGSSADDAQSTVELRVFTEGEEFVIENEKTFISDAVYGSLEEPYVLDLNASAIRTINADELDDMDWYTLQGFKIGRRPTQPGVYIHHGEKVTISSKQLK